MLLTKAKALRKGATVVLTNNGKKLQVEHATYNPREQTVTVHTTCGQTYLHTELSNREDERAKARLRYLHANNIRALDAQAGRFHHAQALRALLAAMPTTFDPETEHEELFEACKRYVVAHKDVNLLLGKSEDGE